MAHCMNRALQSFIWKGTFQSVVHRALAPHCACGESHKLLWQYNVQHLLSMPLMTETIQKSTNQRPVIPQPTEEEKTRRKEAHTQGWRPLKRLTRYQMDHMKLLRQEDPKTWTVSKLSESFSVSPVAVKRILRSRFEPSPEVQERQDAKALSQRKERRSKYVKSTTQNNEQ